MSKQAFIDKFLAQVLATVSEEISGLLGQELGCSGHTGRFVRRADFLGGQKAPWTLTTMEVSGDRSGKAYLATGLKEAIILGGTLILLPEEELEERLANQNFDGETVDAFGEIANIVAGVYTSAAAEAFSKKFHFKKTDVQAHQPGPAATQAPLPEGGYYVSATRLTLDGAPLGTLETLFPIELFGLEFPAMAKPDGAGETGQPGEWGSPGQGPAQGAPPARQPSADAAAAAPAGKAPAGAPLGGEAEGAVAATAAADLTAVLVVGATGEDAEHFSAPLQNQGYEILCAGTQDNLREELAGRGVQMAFLVLNEVGERGFAASIKIKSAVGEKVPLVVAGPQWTRSAVLQAIKYGACDILMTPASPEELREKVRANSKGGRKAAC